MFYTVEDPIASLLGDWSLEVNVYSVLLRILLSVALASVIGCERSSKRHSAGLRTFILVSLASTAAMLTDIYLCENSPMTISLLAAYGIPCFKYYDLDGGAGKVINGFSGYGASLYVPQTMLEEARNILNAEAVEEDENDDGLHA